MESAQSYTNEIQSKKSPIIRIALAGNPNVGKSVIFNQLTGMSQIVGNWPGKTVSKAEGKAKFGNYIFNIIDLPGIYSLSTYSLEEIVSREYIVNEKPDYIINVVDANHLERNLFFTLQLLMLGRPVILALNQYDLLVKRGFEIDFKKLEELLGVIVVPTIAVHNRGIHELLEKIIELEEKRCDLKRSNITFGKEIETKVKKIDERLEKNYHCSCPNRFMALKLLEKDQACIDEIHDQQSKSSCEDHSLLDDIGNMCQDLEELHGEQISTIINAEIYQVASQINEKIETIKKPTRKEWWHNFVDHITIHSIWGYFILALVMLGAYSLVFIFGDLISGLLDGLLNIWTPWAINVFGGESSWWYRIIWSGIMGGLIAGVGGVLPYVVPFYFIIEVLQDTGYLPRAAYLMDRVMHALGVHGKTIIPILLGFGCNVPAVTAATIMETEQEKKRAILISSMIPCSAVTTIVLGLIAKYLGFGYAVLLYLINFAVIVIVGRFMVKYGDKGEQTELIIELHDFRKPNFAVIAKQTWFRSKEFVYMALPLIVILGIILQIMMDFNLLDPINIFISPITVYTLGLPIGVGIYLIYGILRKELNLVLLELYVASLGLTMTEYMAPIQMIVFTLVTMLYVPCLATIITIRKEAGIKFAIQIFMFQIVIAVIVSALVKWGYELVQFLI